MFGFLEILSKLNQQNLSYGLIFLIGFLVSFHCIGMCGGLIITYTASAQAKKIKSKSYLLHWQYNIGRLISYTLIGAILGGFGSFFGISPVFNGLLTLGAGIFMILMGISLINHFQWIEKIKPKMPSAFARFFINQSDSKKPKGPFIIGLLNGFMPCGPLQAIELYALASADMMRGALSMGIFALGTIPLMFGFGNLISFFGRQKIKQIMKISGAIVILLGLLMINRGLANFGYSWSNIFPVKTENQIKNTADDLTKDYQAVNMDLTYNGYSPNALYVKKDIAVRWIINVKQMSGCTNKIIMPQYNIEKSLQLGENIIEFTPTSAGEIKFSCAMQMVWGKFIVTD